MKSKCLLLSSFFLLVLGCGSFKETSLQTEGRVIKDPTKTVVINPLNVSYSEKEFISSVKHIKYIPLKTSKESLLSSIDKVIDFEGLYYVLDKKTSSIFVFDEKGFLQRKLHKNGEGPGEFLSIEGFDIDKEKKQMLVYSLESHKVLVYDLNLNFLNQNKSLLFSHNFMIHPENKDLVFFTQGSIYKEGTNYNLLFTDRSLHIKNNFFGYTYEQYKNFIVNLETGTISTAHKGILYNEGFSDTIFVSDGKISESRYVIDFGINKMPEEIKHDGKMFGKTINYSSIGNSINETSQKLVFSFSYEKYDYTAYFDRKNKTVIYNNRLRNTPFYIFRPPVGVNTKTNTFISFIDKKWLNIANRLDEAAMINIKTLFPAFAEAVASVSEDDNPILAVYTFK